MFDYEKLLYDSLLVFDNNNNNNNNFKAKHLWVKKATGLGITEFFLRFMSWLCLRNDDYNRSQICIVTGPNIDIAIKLIKRMKGLFEPKLGVTFDSKETVLQLNGCTIEAYPSNHLDAYRALDNPKFILIDESDFFRKGEQEDVRYVSERYIAKSDPYIVMVSTPNVPGGLFERIEKEPESTCLYKRLYLDYTVGLGKIYTIQEIERAKQSPSFEREYGLKYLGRIGNTFLSSDIDKALLPILQRVANYNYINDHQANATAPIDPDQFIYGARKSMGIDPAWGSSNFGIVVTRYVDWKVQVLYAEEFERPDFNWMVGKVWELYQQYRFNGDTDRIYVDGANPSFIRSLKLMLAEREDYEKIIEHHRSMSKQLWQDPQQYMTVVPVNFAKEHKDMIAHCRNLMSSGLVTIYPKERFDKLITSLRTAVDNEGTLDKDATSYADIFDAFRLAMKFYRFEQ